MTRLMKQILWGDKKRKHKYIWKNPETNAILFFRETRFYRLRNCTKAGKIFNQLMKKWSDEIEKEMGIK